MPDTGLKFGPAVVVNLADRQLSGSRELRIAPRLEAAEDCWPPFFSLISFSGTATSKFAMIWSAVLRRSDERSGESGLTLRSVSIQSIGVNGFTDVWLLLKHFTLSQSFDGMDRLEEGLSSQRCLAKSSFTVSH